MYSLSNYLPAQSVQQVSGWLSKHNCNLKISSPRKTKFGDYKFSNNQHHITINNDLNKYAFLITLTHEIAHMFVFEKYRNSVLPHGTEWKMTFQKLMLNFIPILPEDIQKSISYYLKNPKASTDSDVRLSLALKGNTAENGKNFVFEVPTNSTFVFKNKLYRKGKKRKTRIECMQITTNRLYLFNQNAEVIVKKL